jgi:uncharacterized membrane protein (DUF373 family)
MNGNNVKQEGRISGIATNLVKKISLRIEKIIVAVLILLMIIVLLLATYELGKFLFNAIFINESGLTLGNVMELFGGFLLVLIGIELLDTIKVYLKDNVVHVEVVLLVAIIALARKIVIYDIETLTGDKIIGIAVLIIALAGAYFLIKKAGIMTLWIEKENEEKKEAKSKAEDGHVS